MFTEALARTMRTLMTSHFVGLLFKTMILALVFFTLFLLLAITGLRSFSFFQDGAMEWFADIGLTFITGYLTWLLLPAFLPMVAAFFQESIANNIEDVEYPGYMPPKMLAPWHQEGWECVKFVLLVIVLHLLLFLS